MQITLFPSFNWIRALASWLSSRTVELLIASRLIKSLSCKQTSSPLANSLALLYPALLLQSGFPNTIYSSWSSSHSSSSARLTEATLCGNGWANTKPISQKCSTWLAPKSFCGGSKGIELQGIGMTLCGNGYWGFTQDCSMLTLLVLPFLLLALISDKKLFHFRVPAVSCPRPFARSICCEDSCYADPVDVLLLIPTTHSRSPPTTDHRPFRGRQLSATKLSGSPVHSKDGCKYIYSGCP